MAEKMFENTKLSGFLESNRGSDLESLNQPLLISETFIRQKGTINFQGIEQSHYGLEASEVLEDLVAGYQFGFTVARGEIQGISDSRQL